MNSVIEVRNLSFTYGDRQILDKVSFDVKPDNFVAVIGENGSGKSTLFNLIVGQLKADEGEIKIFGEKLDKRYQYQKIAYISQNAINSYKNFPTTVEEVIKVHLSYLKKKGQLDKCLNLVGLSKHRGKMLRELSGGELQRVALSLAILKDTDLIMLDEPTSAIDKKFRKEFFDILKKFTEKGKTILMATHNMDDVAELVDDVMLVKGGKVKIFKSKDIEKEIS